MSEPTTTSSPRTTAYLTLGLWLAILVVFGQVVGHPFASYDDRHFILSNPQIIAPGQAAVADLLMQPHIGYIVPVTGLFEAALYALGGGAPWPFHLAGLLLHGVVATLLLLLVRRLTGNVWVAGLGALLFALHPIAAEPVAWATGLKDLLMSSAALGATLCFVRGVDSGRRSAFVGAAVLALMAALSKPTGALLTGAWLAWLVARWWARRDTSDDAQRDPPAAWRVTVIVGLVTALITLASWFMHDTLLVAEDEEVGKGSFQALLALGHEVSHLIWPDSLYPRYRIVRDAGFDDPHTTLGLVVFLAFVAGVWFVRRRPRVILGLALATVAYLPVSNIAPFPRMVADSYVYLPLAGLVIAAAVPVAAWLERTTPHARRAALAVALALGVVCGVRAHAQAARWASPEGIWYPAAVENDDWLYAWMQMGDGMRFAGEHERALGVFEQLFARAYAPEYINKIGLILVELDRLDEAECIMVEDLNFGLDRNKALNNYGVLLVTNPERQPRYPGWARGVLVEIAHRLEAGEMKWPPPLIGGLRSWMLRLDTLPDAPDAPWLMRTCPQLRVERREGVPD